MLTHKMKKRILYLWAFGKVSCAYKKLEYQVKNKIEKCLFLQTNFNFGMI
jgi:hypothetical protein